MQQEQEQEQEQELIKLTDNEAITGRAYYTPLLWGTNVTHKKPNIKQKMPALPEISNSDLSVVELASPDYILCSDRVFHAYKSLPLALFLDPTYGGYLNYKLGFAWKAKGVVVADDGLKVGCSKLTTIERLPIPEVTKVQRIAFAFLCYKTAFPEDEYIKVIDDFLSGKDRRERELYGIGLQKNLLWLLEPGLSNYQCMYTTTSVVKQINRKNPRINFQKIAEEAIQWQ